jgi:hypothetical protein
MDGRVSSMVAKESRYSAKRGKAGVNSGEFQEVLGM